MKKLVLLTTMFITVSANAGFLDGVSSILGKTGNVLNTITGNTNTGSIIQNSSAYKSKSILIRIPDKETSEYKFENMTIDLSSAMGTPIALLTGNFYNKTDKPSLRVTMTMPTHNSEGFEDVAIQATPMASAHGKVKIQEAIDLRYADSRPDLNKIKYIPLKY